MGSQGQPSLEELIGQANLTPCTCWEEGKTRHVDLCQGRSICSVPICDRRVEQIQVNGWGPQICLECDEKFEPKFIKTVLELIVCPQCQLFPAGNTGICSDCLSYSD